MIIRIHTSAGGRYKILGGPALKDLDRLEHLVNHHCIESGKIWGGALPPGRPSSAGPAISWHGIKQSFHFIWRTFTNRNFTYAFVFVLSAQLLYATTKYMA